MTQKQEKLLARTRERIEKTVPAGLGIREASFIMLNQINQELQAINEMLVKYILAASEETEARPTVIPVMKKKKKWWKK